jgi:hypothetical protein
MNEWVVYWLHDECCICLQRHGYVGISGAFMQRLSTHQRNTRFPAHFEWSIIFTGTKSECLVLERTLRPEPGVGWNRSRGGKPVIEFTEAVRANMRKTKRTREQIESDRMAAQEARRSGAWRDNLSKALTGHVRSEASRAAQSATTKGTPKSQAHKAAMSEAARQRYAREGERKKMSEAVRAGKARIKKENENANLV